jgi:hypothetical protein
VQGRTRQIEKDERFWTAASLRHLFDHPNRESSLATLLSRAFGEEPPVDGIETWEECLAGDLALYFEAQMPSPGAYVDWLRQNLAERHCIPYVFDAAARESQRTLEGPTHCDAVLVNPSNGFNLLIEAKVLSDIAPHVSFDMFRNQLVRGIDVMLDAQRCMGGCSGSTGPIRARLLAICRIAYGPTGRSWPHGLAGSPSKTSRPSVPGRVRG